MNFGYFWVFWRIFLGYTGIPLPPLADPDSTGHHQGKKIPSTTYIIAHVTSSDNSRWEKFRNVGVNFSVQARLQLWNH